MSLTGTLLGILLAVPLAATTLTGTLKGPDGTGLTGTLSLTLSQQAALQGGGCGGPVEVLPNRPVTLAVTGGSVSGTVYGNDCMLPLGLYYNVSVRDSGGNLMFADRWVITGSSMDVGTIVSAVVTGTYATLGTTGYVMTSPSAGQTVTQPTGTALAVNNVTVTSALTFPDGTQCLTSGCSALTTNTVTLSGAQTITGVKTFGANILAQSGSSLGIATRTNPFNTSAVRESDVTNIKIWTGDFTTDWSTFVASGAGSYAWLDSSSQGLLAYSVSGGSYSNAAWTVTGSIIPTTVAVGGISGLLYNLGSNSNPWDAIFANSIWMGTNGAIVMGSGDSFIFEHLTTGSDVDCSLRDDGLVNVRTDNLTLQFCIGHSLHWVGLN